MTNPDQASTKGLLLKPDLLLPTYAVMEIWRPANGPNDDDHRSWTQAIADLKSNGELLMTVEGVRHDMRPVTLGPDGTVWDGENRVIGAYMKGLLQIPCTFAFIES